MKRYSVKEGITVVLELIDDAGNVEIFQPDCDLDKAQSVLYQFYNIPTSSGINVKDAFIHEDTDWFPTTISKVYWQYFYQVVKYRPLLEKYLLGQVEFKSISPGKFYNLIQIILKAQGKDKGIFKNLIRKMYTSTSSWLKLLHEVTESWFLSVFCTKRFKNMRLMPLKKLNLSGQRSKVDLLT